MRTLFVIFGAAIGAPARFAIDQYIRKFSNKPYGIFLVNVLGSFLLGVTLNSSEHTHDLFAIGFAGAFTTWSTFMLDIYLALELKRKNEALINLGVSLGFGLLAAWLGLKIGNIN
jgi:CrcB protein